MIKLSSSEMTHAQFVQTELCKHLMNYTCHDDAEKAPGDYYTQTHGLLIDTHLALGSLASAVQLYEHFKNHPEDAELFTRMDDDAIDWADALFDANVHISDQKKYSALRLAVFAISRKSYRGARWRTLSCKYDVLPFSCKQGQAVKNIADDPELRQKVVNIRHEYSKVSGLASTSLIACYKAIISGQYTPPSRKTPKRPKNMMIAVRNPRKKRKGKRISRESSEEIVLVNGEKRIKITTVSYYNVE